MATRNKAEGPKARQVREPSKKAATIPSKDKPATRRGEPKINIIKLLKRADLHVGGEVLNNCIA